MNKKKLLIRGVAFSYGAVAAQICYSFVSIPLALAHLSKEEFGLWGLITTVSGYLVLVELGLSNAMTRHLLECSGEEGRDKYGRLFGGSALAFGSIGVAVFGLGLAFSHLAWRLFPIPQELIGKFVDLMMGQSLLTALGLATQVFAAPLYVNHRQDLNQIRGIVQFLIMFLVLYAGFEAGWGLYAMLANQAAAFLWSFAFNLRTCRSLGFYPTRHQIGLPLRSEWASIWAYAKGVFVVQIGSLTLNSLPPMMIAKLLGLEAAATWAVCTRPFTILRQVVGRPFDVALPMLYDSFIAGKMEDVTQRWSQLSQGILAASGVLFSVAAVNNASFIGLWTGGRIHWDWANHLLLTAYFLAITAAGLASGGLGMSKSVGRIRYTAFLQLVPTVGLSVLGSRCYGTAGLILAFTIPYGPGLIYSGVRYLATITGQRRKPLLWDGILRPAATIPVCLLLAWLCTFTSDLLPAYGGLLLSATLGTLSASTAMMAFGISPQLRAQAFELFKRSVRRESIARAGL
jgi:O-antigen/teichoic acid export membrane protein